MYTHCSSIRNVIITCPGQNMCYGVMSYIMLCERERERNRDRERDRAIARDRDR